MQLCSLL